jgi:predicted nucleic acid-binding protein
VVNSSPLVALAKVGRISLLTDLCQQLVVPLGVASEVRAGDAGDPARAWLDSIGASHVCDQNPIHPLVAAWDLGCGESEVLSYAQEHPGFEAIVDDRAARYCARLLGIPCRGTVGVLLLAKKENRLSSVKEVLGRLQDAGLRLSPALVQKACHLAGE